MQLNNTFAVSLPIEEAWKTFLDLERVAPCLPGAAITGVDGGTYHGGVKIKVGPISAQYRGVARFVETDDVAHRAVISAQAKDIGGQGNVNATITANLVPQGDGTQVHVETELDLSGRVAQFGRGVISDVSGKLLGQFSKNLEAEINHGSLGKSGAAVGAPAGTHDSSGVAPAPARVSLDDVEPLDVMGSMGGLVAKYALPALAGTAIVVVGAILLGRRSRAGNYLPAVPGATGYSRLSPVNVFLTLPSPSSLVPTTTSALPGRSA